MPRERVKSAVPEELATDAWTKLASRFLGGGYWTGEMTHIGADKYDHRYYVEPFPLYDSDRPAVFDHKHGIVSLSMPGFAGETLEWNKNYFPRDRVRPELIYQSEVEFFCGPDVRVTSDVTVRANSGGYPQPELVFLAVGAEHLPDHWYDRTYDLGMPPNSNLDVIDPFTNIAFSTRSRLAQTGLFFKPVPTMMQMAMEYYQYVWEQGDNRLIPLPALAYNFAPRPHQLRAGDAVGAFYRRTQPLTGAKLYEAMVNNEVVVQGEYGRDYWLVSREGRMIEDPELAGWLDALTVRIRVQEDNLLTIKASEQPIALELSLGNRLGPMQFLEPVTKGEKDAWFAVSKTPPVRVGQNHCMVIQTGEIMWLGTHLSSPLIHAGSDWTTSGATSGIKLEYYVADGQPREGSYGPTASDFFVYPLRARVDTIDLRRFSLAEIHQVMAEGVRRKEAKDKARQRRWWRWPRGK